MNPTKKINTGSQSSNEYFIGMEFEFQSGLEKFSQVRLTLSEKPPALVESERTIREFWKRFSRENSESSNIPLYALRGRESAKIVDGVLEINAYLSDYATLRFKNSRDEQAEKTLDDLTKDFFKYHFAVLGVAGYIHHEQEYLIGTRLELDARAGLEENLPAGLIDPEKDRKQENIFLAALKRKLYEETRLFLEDDVQSYTVTHLNHGPRYGDFTLIYDLPISRNKMNLVSNNPTEHSRLAWRKKEELLEAMRSEGKYNFNPSAYALFEKLLSVQSLTTVT